MVDSRIRRKQGRGDVKPSLFVAEVDVDERVSTPGGASSSDAISPEPSAPSPVPVVLAHPVRMPAKEEEGDATISRSLM